MAVGIVRAETIEDVIEHLDAIVEQSRQANSRLGYFAALYRNVTRRVKRDIERGRFEDGARMERLDVRFANRYFDAYHQYEQDRRPARCWAVAFDATKHWSPIILQHLLLGMNAHINLDLGVAAARISPGAALAGLQRDFREINALLIEMLEEVQDQLSSVSPWLGVLDRVGCDKDEWLARIGLKGARESAWSAAKRLAFLEGAQQASLIEEIDARVARWGRALLRPGPLIRGATFVVRCAEREEASMVIDALSRN